MSFGALLRLIAGASPEPPVAQSDAPGPQTANVTSPVGLPLVALPVTVAVSDSVAPTMTDGLAGEELVEEVARMTLKHSSAEVSLEGSLSVSPW